MKEVVMRLWAAWAILRGHAVVYGLAVRSPLILLTPPGRHVCFFSNEFFRFGDADDIVLDKLSLEERYSSHPLEGPKVEDRRG